MRLKIFKNTINRIMLLITFLISITSLLMNFTSFLFIINIIINLKDKANQLFKKISSLTNQNDSTLLKVDFNNLESEIKQMKEIGRGFKYNIIISIIFLSLSFAFLFASYFCNKEPTALTKLLLIIYTGLNFGACSIFIYDCIYQMSYVFNKKSNTLK